MGQNCNLDDLIMYCREFALAGYAPASGGNASLRTPEGILITGSGSTLRRLDKTDFVLVNEEGEPINTERRPSKEVFLHIAVYRSNPRTRAIFHFHPPHTIAACSLLPEGEDQLPAMVPTYIMRVRGAILVPFFPPGVPELAEEVGRQARVHQVVLLKNHGLVSSGATIQEAAQAVEETEENARIYLMAGGRGKALSQRECKALQERYWAKE